MEGQSDNADDIGFVSSIQLAKQTIKMIIRCTRRSGIY